MCEVLKQWLKKVTSYTLYINILISYQTVLHEQYAICCHSSIVEGNMIPSTGIIFCCRVCSRNYFEMGVLTCAGHVRLLRVRKPHHTRQRVSNLRILRILSLTVLSLAMGMGVVFVLYLGCIHSHKYIAIRSGAGAEDVTGVSRCPISHSLSSFAAGVGCFQSISPIDSSRLAVQLDHYDAWSSEPWNVSQKFMSGLVTHFSVYRFWSTPSTAASCSYIPSFHST